MRVFAFLWKELNHTRLIAYLHIIHDFKLIIDWCKIKLERKRSRDKFNKNGYC